ncbi:hypothetical protein FAIPA1_140115 [Frankia sp. AiPs1]
MGLRSPLARIQRRPGAGQFNRSRQRRHRLVEPHDHVVVVLVGALRRLFEHPDGRQNQHDDTRIAPGHLGEGKNEPATEAVLPLEHERRIPLVRVLAGPVTVEKSGPAQPEPGEHQRKQGRETAQQLVPPDPAVDAVLGLLQRSLGRDQPLHGAERKLPHNIVETGQPLRGRPRTNLYQRLVQDGESMRSLLGCAVFSAVPGRQRLHSGKNHTTRGVHGVSRRWISISFRHPTPERTTAWEGTSQPARTTPRLASGIDLGHSARPYHIEKHTEWRREALTRRRFAVSGPPRATSRTSGRIAPVAAIRQ